MGKATIITIFAYPILLRPPTTDPVSNYTSSNELFKREPIHDCLTTDHPCNTTILTGKRLKGRSDWKMNTHRLARVLRLVSWRYHVRVIVREVLRVANHLKAPSDNNNINIFNI